MLGKYGDRSHRLSCVLDLEGMAGTQQREQLAALPRGAGPMTSSAVRSSQEVWPGLVINATFVVIAKAWVTVCDDRWGRRRPSFRFFAALRLGLRIPSTTVIGDAAR